MDFVFHRNIHSLHGTALMSQSAPLRYSDAVSCASGSRKHIGGWLAVAVAAAELVESPLAVWFRHVFHPNLVHHTVKHFLHIFVLATQTQTLHKLLEENHAFIQKTLTKAHLSMKKEPPLSIFVHTDGRASELIEARETTPGNHKHSPLYARYVAVLFIQSFFRKCLGARRSVRAVVVNSKRAAPPCERTLTPRPTLRGSAAPVHPGRPQGMQEVDGRRRLADEDGLRRATSASARMMVDPARVTKRQLDYAEAGVLWGSGPLLAQCRRYGFGSLSSGCWLLRGSMGALAKLS